MMAASANIFYIKIDYKNKINMKLVASNINIKIMDVKIYELFSKQRILGVHVNIVQRKI